MNSNCPFVRPVTAILQGYRYCFLFAACVFVCVYTEMLFTSILFALSCTLRYFVYFVYFSIWFRKIDLESNMADTQSKQSDIVENNNNNISIHTLTLTHAYVHERECSSKQRTECFQLLQINSISLHRFSIGLNRLKRCSLNNRYFLALDFVFENSKFPSSTVFSPIFIYPMIVDIIQSVIHR